MFLNVSHRFKDDPSYGEIMRRFRIEQATKEDMQMINRKYCENSYVILPPVPKIRCTYYMNDERNAYNNVVLWNI